MVLTKDILKELSGLQKPAAICRWLDRQRIPYLKGADKWPKVLEAAIMAKLGGKAAAMPINEPRMRRLDGTYST